jgi:N-acetylglucosaminyldiphosphoundecaprenol N-acetyl-beta-D-mannosaminyltransferase
VTARGSWATFSIQGINFAAINVSNAADLIFGLATSAKGEYVAVSGAHGVVESAYDERIRVAHQHASIVVPDGMPIVWLGRLLGFDSVGRVYGPELMETMFSKPECRKLRHFFYGSSPSVVSRLRETLASRFGEFNMVGMHCPPMRPLGFAEDEEVIERLRQIRPQIIWIGLSTPKQELWLHMHMHQIGTGIGIGVGAAFDLLSGRTTQAPRWVQRAGLEWLFRTIVEPRRLVRRYCFVIPRFLWFFVKALLTHQKR